MLHGYAFEKRTYAYLILLISLAIFLFFFADKLRGGRWLNCLSKWILNFCGHHNSLHRVQNFSAIFTQDKSA
jgi:surface polysaccharide O-acyltransferase-like enzyme